VSPEAPEAPEGPGGAPATAITEDAIAALAVDAAIDEPAGRAGVRICVIRRVGLRGSGWFVVAARYGRSVLESSKPSRPDLAMRQVRALRRRYAR
jgi:hypothetical protein